nr:reverse transcriptase domain-containing protein [Tanacetum cinerariifolium]
MQTRSSSRLVSGQSSNPTSSTNSNPKGRNRRRSKKRVVNSNLEEHSHPVVTISDQRTMARLLQAPTEGYEDAIIVPVITADNFELKHGLLTLLDTFYNDLNSKDQDSLNFAAGGNFLDKIPRECLRIIESKSKVRYSRDKPIVAKVSTNASTSGVSPDVDELKDMVKALLLDKKGPVYQPPIFQQPAYQAPTYLVPAPQTQGVSKEDFSANVKANDAVMKNMQTQGQNMQNQLTNRTDLITKFVNSNSASTLSSGTLPSNTIANLKSDLKAITTRSGVSYDGPQIPPPVVENEPDATKDTVNPTNNGNTEDVQPQAVQYESLVISEPEIALVSASKPNPKASIPYPSRRNDERNLGVAEDVYVKVGSFYFLADFVVVDFDADPRVPLILKRSFLKTRRALIDVFEGELTLRVGKEAITLNLDQTSSGGHTSFKAFLNDDPSLPPPNQRNYLPEVRKELKICEAKSDKSSVDEPPVVELKALPPHLEYAFLEGDDKLPIIIAKDLSVEEKTALITVLKSHNPWVNPVHCVPKKGGFTVVKNEDNELIPTRLVTGWRVCIDYCKLNEATRKDHFPLPFMDQMLERLAGNQYYCFLDGFSGYFQIPIDPKDQEKTTFTCHTERLLIAACLLGYTMLQARFREGVYLAKKSLISLRFATLDQPEVTIDQIRQLERACHLPPELEHKAYRALKHANFDLKTAGDHRKIQINELNELRDQAYKNSLNYKEKTKRIHDSKIKNRVFNIGDREKTKRIHDSKIKNRVFNIGDRVLLFNSRLKIFSDKLKIRWSGPFTISQVFPYGTVEFLQPDGPNFKVNGHRLKHYFGEDVPKLVVLDLQTFAKDH